MLHELDREPVKQFRVRRPHTVESEVANREAELEALLARQATLKQRTDLASVTVHLVTKEQAISIAILDRSISYGSLVVLGFIVFLLTHVDVPRTRSVQAEG